jgi:FkbM family methyltransferase
MNLSLPALPNELEYNYKGHRLHHSVFNLEWLDKPKVILDVGTWDFGDSIRFKERFPDCEVFGFELLPENYAKFAGLAESVGVHTDNLAISNDCGYSPYYEAKHQHGDNAQSSLLAPSDLYLDKYGSIVTHTKSEKSILCTTIELLCLCSDIKEIDLLHIGVEGAEYQVIEGIGSIRPKLIFAEFLLDGGWINQKSFKETCELLNSLGYEEVKSMGHDKLFLHSSKGKENE